MGGHSGVAATTQRLSSIFFWKGMRRHIRAYIRDCDICLRNKTETVASPGLLQPLPIPEYAFKDISMDFISGLPRSEGKDTILVIVDRLTKYGHFVALSHPYTAPQVAHLFLDHVLKLHGMPSSIVTDWDPLFLSSFWKELFKLQGVTLHYSSAYHPQTDGQTEVLNHCLEGYLRCM